MKMQTKTINKKENMSLKASCQIQRKFQFPIVQKAGHVSRNELNLDYRRISGS